MKIKLSSKEMNARIHQIIPGGGHTYSKGDDQFPENAPLIMSRAKGAYCWDADGHRYLDWAMGNRVMILGHAFDEVDDAVIRAIKDGTNYTRPGILEYELAEYLVDLWPGADMVKFGKNGSDVTTAAIKLARAFTGRDYVAVCGSHPFFSSNDWFIGSTKMNSGTLESERPYTLKFEYNDEGSVDRILEEYCGRVAAIILEPVKYDAPYQGGASQDYHLDGLLQAAQTKETFLHKLRAKADEHGIVLIFDEMISGMRFCCKGAHHLFGVYPDLMTFGKAISNGYSCSVLGGKSEIMGLGGIHHDKARVFLLSQTHSSETVGLAATLSTIKAFNRLNVTSHIWSTGKEIKAKINHAIDVLGLSANMSVIGYDANPMITFTKIDGTYWPELATLFQQELILKDILMPWISVTYSHTASLVEETLAGVDDVLQVIAQSVQGDRVNKVLRGPAIKPVFRNKN